MPSDEGSNPGTDVQESPRVVTPPEKGGPGYVPKAIIAEESFYLDIEHDLDSKWPGKVYREKPLIDKFWT